MLISKKMNTELNKQVANEMNASHKYLAMSCSFMGMGLKIFATRFRKQSDEERGHALKIVDYIHDVNGTVSYDAVAKPKGDYTTVRAIVKAALDSEMTVTAQINDLVALADKEKDYATRSFLNWFVDEQVEEVSSMTELLQWVTMTSESNLFQLENRLAQAMS
jgi:ferritin